ncbi:uncharacterized protein A4U43_C02F3340 [Asparagus officinalis]|uniref:Uncharacterized protein n=1 Tax=Asparagus officinalis TaxID=4686 RepID=A0A5P1FGD5_ASPOF|nr:uncharacterized protein LOC109830025 [Asparagus officinalis]ONK77124.1 uncharacterized protein A4U43_C02F3340 [Asparagus officinalis]
MDPTHNPDAWVWITNLPPVTQWERESISLCIWTSQSAQGSLNLSTVKIFQNPNHYGTFSITIDANISITLWTSKSLPIENKGHQAFSEKTILHLFFDIVAGVLRYGPNKRSSYRMPPVPIDEEFPSIFNLAFLTLTLLVCIYEAPQDLLCECVDTLRLHLITSSARQATKLLVRIFGSNLEEQWMRSVNLAITNLMVEREASNHSFRSPSPLFSYAFSAIKLWKAQVYCPIIAINVEDPSATTHDERLLFSLNYQQLEASVQFSYKVIFQENWIDIVVKVDNIRCNVSSLVSDALMSTRGYGTKEKFFPSRISLQLTPTIQTDVLSVSVGKSSDNPTQEIGLEKGIESSFDPRNLKVSASESVTMSMKLWKFEQSVYGNSVIFNWFLHDGVNGREVFSSKPSKCAIFQRRSWFRNRYSSVYRPFTKQGGVVFAEDEYGKSVWWKVNGEAAEKIMEWEIRGRIWLTYWPNKHITFHNETRMLEFRQLVHIPLAKVA